MRTLSSIATLATLVLLMASCRQDMQDQPRYKPLGASRFFADGRDARPIPAGTIARDELNDTDSFYTGRGERHVSRYHSASGQRRVARSRPRPVRYFLQPMPRTHRGWQRNGCSAGSENSCRFSYRSTTLRAAGLSLSSHQKRLRSNGRLRRSGPGKRSLGHRRLHKSLAAQ